MSPHGDDSIVHAAAQQQKIIITFLALAWLFVLLRIWTRTYIISSFGWDDATMIFANLIFTTYCASLLYVESNGGGTHISSIPQLQRLIKWVLVGETTYLMAMMTLKISLGIFFARIVVQQWQVRLIYATVGTNIFSSIAAFFYCLFRCGSNIDNYVSQQLTLQCTPRTLDRFMAYQAAGITTLTDIVFVTLPVFILWNANMSRRSKTSVGFILCLAALGVICSILRMRYVDGLTEFVDFFWVSVQIGTWSTIECGASIIAGCLATLRPLLKHLAVTTRDASVLGSCMKQVSWSFRSSARSEQSTLPHYHSKSSDTKAGSSRHQPISITGQMDTPTLLEFMAHPGEEVFALNGCSRDGRTSTDPILNQQPGVDGVNFPWPAKRRDSDRRRQTMHASWTLRDGVASDGRTSQREILK